MISWEKNVPTEDCDIEKQKAAKRPFFFFWRKSVIDVLFCLAEKKRPEPISDSRSSKMVVDADWLLFCFL